MLGGGPGLQRQPQLCYTVSVCLHSALRLSLSYTLEVTESSAHLAQDPDGGRQPSEKGRFTVGKDWPLMQILLGDLRILSWDFGRKYASRSPS